jgi:hypothetical protein
MERMPTATEWRAAWAGGRGRDVPVWSSGTDTVWSEMKRPCTAKVDPLTRPSDALASTRCFFRDELMLAALAFLLIMLGARGGDAIALA